ncbi:immediate early response 3-interacting protein 1-like [Panonychus citri]|uniref:immediate early response 3-interacting protein 1-like n=1 Tax=Panonychus citri TaxID=50023 RepID=UPI00230713F5|nr:immediate early response 3-interacting protein 1-like [Panonychus citri]
MAITLYNLFESILLIVNGIAILHEERFLKKIGCGRDQNNINFNQPYGIPPPQPGVKANVLNLIHSIRTVMRVPLIFFNVVTIVFKLLIG